MVNSFNILIHTRQCTRYTNTSCCVIQIVIFYSLESCGFSIQYYLSPLNRGRVTFSLLLSSLNISSISCLQSSCMVWKLSWGVVIKGEVDISSSRRRISAKVGLWWDSWCQQSEKVTIQRKCCLVSWLYFQKLLWCQIYIASCQ